METVARLVPGRDADRVLLRRGDWEEVFDLCRLDGRIALYRRLAARPKASGAYRSTLAALEALKAEVGA